MRYSRLFGKTSFGEQKGSDMVSHQLLIRGGFIRESTAGRYFFLPLGWRVHEKIKAIIKEEMDQAGAQEMISPVLHPLELWKETNRTNTTGFELMKVKDRRGAEFALGGTAEEMFVDVVRRMNLTYKDLPINIYQFSTKFRDELRARGGLLRVREFVMKDGYSFHVDKEDFAKEYASMATTYVRIFQRMGLQARAVEADNGYIGGEYCHEFQVEHPDGEGRYFISDDGTYVAHGDVARMKLSPVNPDDEVLPFEIIPQPQWVKTMDDNVKHYEKDKRYYLKNVVYVSTVGDIYIVTIRGDLDVNKTKVEHVLNLVGQLTEATEDDLKAIGTQPGYVHSWGHQFVESRKRPDGMLCTVTYIADESLKSVKNFIGGQKEDETDSINVNYGRDFTHAIEADVAEARDGEMAWNGSGVLHEKRGIEVGNIFQLGYHYTNLMKNAVFVDRDGKTKPYYMGCYGIGLGRTMATIVEQYHDDKGICWPVAVAPYVVELVSVRGAEAQAESIYKQLVAHRIDVLWDDRDISPGVKFADADLIGMPVRLVVSPRTGEQVEYKLRTSADVEVVSLEEAIERITNLLLEQQS
jgi:prolyl-tRNA synthetase